MCTDDSLFVQSAPVDALPHLQPPLKKNLSHMDAVNTVVHFYLLFLKLALMAAASWFLPWGDVVCMLLCVTSGAADCAAPSLCLPPPANHNLSLLSLAAPSRQRHAVR